MGNSCVIVVQGGLGNLTPLSEISWNFIFGGKTQVIDLREIRFTGHLRSTRDLLKGLKAIQTGSIIFFYFLALFRQKISAGDCNYVFYVNSKHLVA